MDNFLKLITAPFKILKAFYLVEGKKDFLFIFLATALGYLNIRLRKYPEVPNYWNGEVFKYRDYAFTYPLASDPKVASMMNLVLKATLEDAEYAKGVGIAKGDTVFDCGANVGVFSVWASPLALKVYAFEPSSQNLSALKVNTQNFPNIEIIDKAVGDRNSTMRLFLHYGIGDCINNRTAEKDGEEIEVITMDSLNIRPDFIKMDIEGFEREALKGAAKILQAKPKLSISLEHRPSDFYEIPLLVHSLNPDYKLVFKRNNIDINLYAY